MSEKIQLKLTSDSESAWWKTPEKLFPPLKTVKYVILLNPRKLS